jgi:hypothetical protein
MKGNICEMRHVVQVLCYKQEIYLILQAALWFLDVTQPLTKISTIYLLGVKVWPAREVDHRPL